VTLFFVYHLSDLNFIFFDKSDLNLYVFVLTHNLYGFKNIKLKYRTFTHNFWIEMCFYFSITNTVRNFFLFFISSWKKKSSNWTQV